MRYAVILKTTSEELGAVKANHSMTDDEIFELADVKIMKTKEDYMTGNGYDFEDLEIEVQEW